MVSIEKPIRQTKSLLLAKQFVWERIHKLSHPNQSLRHFPELFKVGPYTWNHISINFSFSMGFILGAKYISDSEIHEIMLRTYIRWTEGQTFLSL